MISRPSQMYAVAWRPGGRPPVVVELAVELLQFTYFHSRKPYTIIVYFMGGLDLTHYDLCLQMPSGHDQSAVNTQKHMFGITNLF